MLYIITLFHSVVINKSFIGSEDNNENLLLDLNRTNLNSSLAVLEATLEKMPNETDPVDSRFVSLIVGEIIYGGYAQELGMLNEFIELGNHLFVNKVDRSEKDKINKILTPLFAKYDIVIDKSFKTFEKMHKFIIESNMLCFYRSPYYLYIRSFSNK